MKNDKHNHTNTIKTVIKQRYITYCFANKVSVKHCLLIIRHMFTYNSKDGVL